MKKISWISLFILVSGLACYFKNEWKFTKQRKAREERYFTITPVQAKEIMAGNKDAIILDVRTREEYESGHVKSAISLPLEEIENSAYEIIPNHETTVLVYCHTGRRSALAAKKLGDIGYKIVFDFGGIVDWTDRLV